MTNGTPDFKDPNLIQDHINKTMAFYHPHCIDPNGGFYQLYLDDGTIFDKETRHLVSSCRFVFTYSMYAKYFGNDEYLKHIEHGLNFITKRHLNKQTDGYRWVLKDNETIDDTNHCYGLAFVMLAYASAVKAGIQNVKELIYETYELMERQFWLEEHGLYADEATGNWSTLSSYRGQNANMHSCEAMIAAFEATNDDMFLNRALMVAKNITQRQTEHADGLIWEHYDENWNIDWDYNKSDPKNLFRPWGFQPGHLTEWSKLLMMLNKLRPESWMVQRATELFDAAMKYGWDNENRGICYGFSPEGNVCDGDKYFWVQAESMAAAAHLATYVNFTKTTQDKYWNWYQKIWQYSWDHMIDHKYGAWFCTLTKDNQKYNDIKSPTGKTDYHTMGACYEILSLLEQ